MGIEEGQWVYWFGPLQRRESGHIGSDLSIRGTVGILVEECYQCQEKEK